MKIVFMGTPQAAVPSLGRLLEDGHEVAAVYTQPDRPSGRGNNIIFSAVKQFALDMGLKIFQPAKIRTEESLEEFRSHDADVAVVVAYGRILPETYLTAYPNGAINVHFSLLPKYRGAAPVNWAIVNGETETGVTTMHMDAGLDTGSVLMQRSTPIGDSENSIELMDRLSVIGADLLSETLVHLNQCEPITQDHGQATLAPIMKREDGLIDWTLPAGEIVNRIRGFQPFPTVFSLTADGKITLWRASATSTGGPRGPGEIVEAGGDRLVIACGGLSALQVEELQPEGKRRMAVRDFLNGTKLKVGDTLGN